MGQNSSMDDQHLDGGHSAASPHSVPASGARASAAAASRVPPGVQVGDQSKPAARAGVGGGGAGDGGVIRREDSGSDFAMSIADGAPASSGSTPGPSQSSAQQQSAQSQAQAQAAQAQQTHSGALQAGEGMASPSPAAPKIETVPTAFKWVHGGQEVYVTGSFNNWQGKILMYPNDDGEFTLLIDIPPGTHHYKYIVDQEWRLDEDAPTVQIATVWNNVCEVKRPVFEYTPANFADSDDDEDERKQKAAYGQRAPLSNDYVNDPPKLPPHLTEVLLNQTQAQDPCMLPVPLHVVLNHLYVMQNTDPSILVTGVTQRFKPNQHTKITHKFVTTVYYGPSQPSATGLNASPLMGPAGMPLSASPRSYQQNYMSDASAAPPFELGQAAR